MNKIYKKILTLLLLSVVVIFTINAQVLEVEEITQEQNQWCWAGTSICVLKYYGDNQITQCEIATWAWSQATWRTCYDNCCNNPSGCCNYWNYIWSYSGSIEHILSSVSSIASTGTQNHSSSLSQNQVANIISDGRPMIVRVNSGGHFIVLHGLVGNTLYYMDPWYGEGKGYQTFSTSQVNGRAWTHTLVCTAEPPNEDTEAPTAPKNLASGNITTSSLNLSWTASTDNESVDHYSVFKDGNQVGTTANTSYNVTGLEAATTYSFTVKALDAAGNISAPSNTETVTTKPEISDYCNSKSSFFTEEWIKEININGVKYESGKSSYSDFTSTIINLNTNTENSLSIYPSFARDPYNEYFSVWIDYNKDGDFEDVNEEVFTENANTSVNGTISIPSSISGETRMRVSMKYNSAPSSCENFQYGEVEDYTVLLEENQDDNQPPSAPGNLSSSNITQTSVNLTWNASDDNVGVDHYSIFKDENQVGTTSALSYEVTGLLPETTYSFTVKALDAAGNISLASNTETITTLPEGVIEYCNSGGNNSSYFWINYVGLNELANSSGNNNGYADYTKQFTNIAKGNTERIYLQTGYSYYTYTVYWTVWIDFNHNGEFESSELVVDGSTAQSTQVYADFQVPTNALTGETRMRISMKYGNLAEPCENYNYGETEDYTIIINQSQNNNQNLKRISKLGYTNLKDEKVLP